MYVLLFSDGESVNVSLLESVIAEEPLIQSSLMSTSSLDQPVAEAPDKVKEISLTSAPFGIDISAPSSVLPF